MKAKLNLQRLFDKAKHSSFYRWLLNRALLRTIPFNNPHGFVIDAITDDSLITRAPYRRRNMNHLKGIHACALATIGELSAGLLLLSLFNPKKYRLILSKLEITYHYQAKIPTLSKATLPCDQQQTLKQQLGQGDVIVLPMQSELHDSMNNHIASVVTTWQIKPWTQVKTQMN